jgi:thiopurine S-methyltransferase
MTNLDANYWTQRYIDGLIGWDIGFCSTPLKDYFDQLTNKHLKVLIPGAGYAHEAKYLHEQGFTNVYVVDLAPEPLAHLKNQCPGFPDARMICQDFFTLEEQYDLIVEQTFFCALDPSMREEYVKKIKSLLKTNGKLVGVLFNRDFEGGPPFGGSIVEYAELFKRHFENLHIQSCYNSITPRQGTEVFFKAW